MTSRLTLARPYARALFSEAKESDSLTEWLSLLNTLSQVLEERAVAHLMKNPTVLDDVLKCLLLELIPIIQPDFPIGLREKVDRFLQLLIVEKRLFIFSEITFLYHQLLNEHNGLVDAAIVTAFPLSRLHKARIQSKLEKRFNAKVKLTVHQDNTLLGGAVIHVGNWAMDGSVKGKLTRLGSTIEALD